MKVSELRVITPSDLAKFGRTPELLSNSQLLRPTETVCKELQGLFDVFNRYLFADELPDCMLTVDSLCRAAYGYFRPDAFTKATGEVIDQISLNPTYMTSRPMRDVAGTVAHEQAHQWVHRCSGERVTGGYHDKTWALKMESIGLMPSDTGLPGGKKSGYRMSHFPIPGGRFLAVVAALEAYGFALTWGQFQESLAAGPGSGRSGRSGKGGRGKSKNKVKYVCAQCGQACWGSGTLSVICGKDHSRMTSLLS